MQTRRSFLTTTAGAGLAMLAAKPSWPSSHMKDIFATTRVLDVDGLAATVFGLIDTAGQQGLRIHRDDGFAVRLHNQLGEPTLIHWHGLTPPVALDGVPGLSQRALEPRELWDYDFELNRAGTFWMHSHLGGQEQALLAAPLIITEGSDATMPEAVIMLHDFAHRGADEIFFDLTGSQIGQMSHIAMGHGGMGGGAMDHSGMMDLNDVEFDAFLANDRTLSDPEIIVAEAGQPLRLRIINAAASTNFWVDLGGLTGRIVAVDGVAVEPVEVETAPIAMAQRLDIVVTLPAAGAYPILAQREGGRQRTGVILAATGAEITRISSLAEAEAPAMLNELESRLRSTEPLAPREVDTVLRLDLTGSMMGYSWGFDAPAPLAADLGQRVEITMVNRSMMSHPMHLHGHHFQVVELGQGRFSGALRDTVMVPAMGRVTIAFDADNPGIWAFHCHNLYHQLAGMMTQFEVRA